MEIFYAKQDDSDDEDDAASSKGASLSDWTVTELTEESLEIQLDLKDPLRVS